MNLGTYWQLYEGIWSPRDQRYGWREWDTFKTKPEALKAVRKLLKEYPNAALLLERHTIEDAWNKERPDWDKSKQVAEVAAN